MLLKSGKGPPGAGTSHENCPARRAGRPAQRSVFRAGQAARAAGRLTGVSASADFCALPRIHEA